MKKINMRSVYPGGTWLPGDAAYSTAYAEKQIETAKEKTFAVRIKYPVEQSSAVKTVLKFPVILELGRSKEELKDPYSFFTDHGYIGVSSAVKSGEDACEIVRWAAERLEGSTGEVCLIGREKDSGFVLRAAAESNVHAVILCDGGLEEDNIEIIQKLNQKEVPILLWTGNFAEYREQAMRTYVAYQNCYSGREYDKPMDVKQSVTAACQLIMGPENPRKTVDLGIWMMWLDNWVKGTNSDLKTTEKPLHLWKGGNGGWFNTSTYPIMLNGKQYFFHADRTNQIAKPDSVQEVRLGKDPICFYNDKLTYVMGMAGAMSATITLKHAAETSVQVAMYDVNADGTKRALAAVGKSDAPYELNLEKTWTDSHEFITWPAYKTTAADSDMKTYYVFMGFVHWDVDSGHRLCLEIKLDGEVPEDCCMILGGSQASSFMHPINPGSCFTHPLQAASPSMWSEKNQCLMNGENHLISTDWGSGTEYTGDFPYEVRDIVTVHEDGKKIVGRAFVPDGKDKCPTVVFVHGIHSVRGVFRTYQDYLARRGIASFAFDCCGGSTRSDSDGDTTEMNLTQMHLDLDAVMKKVKILDFVDMNQIFLCGHSQGGLVAATYAPSHVDDIKAMILLAPGLSLCDTAINMFKTDAEIPDTVVLMMPLGRQWFMDLRHIDPYEIARGYKKNVMITHGTADLSVPVTVSRKLVDCYDSVTYYEVPDAPHEYVDDDMECLKVWMYDFLKKNID